MPAAKPSLRTDTPSRGGPARTRRPVAPSGKGTAGDAAGPADLTAHPGHLIRRLQQIAVAVFLQETEAFGVTPVQYAALYAVGDAPGIDQRTLARTIGLDTSTVAGIVDRLEVRGLLQRGASPQDRRVRLLTISDRGQRLLADIVPAVHAAQRRMLEPLSPTQRQQFMRMLHRLVISNNALSRAPREV